MMNSTPGTAKAPTDLRIVILGGGIGGAAAAVALQQQGIRAEIYEQASELREIGAALSLHPPTIQVFQQWGIADQFAPFNTRAHWMVTLRPDGTLLEKLPMPTPGASPDNQWVDMILRADLHNTLLKQLPVESIHLNRKCIRIADDAAYAEVHFADGSVIKADLVIAADGIHSIARQLIVEDKPQFSGIHACRGLIPREKTLNMAELDAITNWRDKTTNIMLVPLLGGKLVYINVSVLSPDFNEESWTTTIAVDDLIEKVREFDPRLHQLIRNIDGPIGDRTIFDRPAIDRWSLNHLTLLGDAAHPMLPIRGQGANMAIQDGAVLAQLLGKGTTTNLQDILQQYEAQRKPVTAMFQRLSQLIPGSDGATLV